MDQEELHFTYTELLQLFQAEMNGFTEEYKASLQTLVRKNISDISDQLMITRLHRGVLRNSKEPKEISKNLGKIMGRVCAVFHALLEPSGHPSFFIDKATGAALIEPQLGRVQRSWNEECGNIAHDLKHTDHQFSLRILHHLLEHEIAKAKESQNQIAHYADLATSTMLNKFK
ncbi:MAG: hypothetical protein V1735_01745 [Nanoarchaeota archaeon]